MRTFAIAAILAASALTAPAQAVSISNITTTGGATVDVITSTPTLIELDSVIGSGGSVTLDLLGTAGETGFDFNAFVEFITSAGINRLVLDLGGAATLTTIGTATGAFSNTAVSATSTRAIVDFNGPEFVSVTLGDVFGGTDFTIALPENSAGSLTLFAVPAPAALALFGLGVFGLAALRRR